MLVNKFKEYILENDLKKALELARQFVINRQTDVFWEASFQILVEYIHLLCPKAAVSFYQNYEIYARIAKRKILKHKKEIELSDIENLVTRIVTLLCFSCKQHISLYIQPSYSRKTKAKNDYTTIKKYLFSLNECLKQMDTSKKVPKADVVRLHDTIGSLFSIECDSVDNIDKNHNNVTIYTHTNSTLHKKIVSQIWCIIQHHSKKLEKQSFWNIKALYNLYNYGLMHRTGRQLFVILLALEYFIKVINYDFIPQMQPKIHYTKKKQQPDPPTIPILKETEARRKYETFINGLSATIKTDPFHMRKLSQAFGVDGKLEGKEKRKRKTSKKNSRKKIIDNPMKWNFRTFKHQQEEDDDVIIEDEPKIILLSKNTTNTEENNSTTIFQVTKLKS